MRQLAQILKAGETRTPFQRVQRALHGIWRVTAAPIGLPIVDGFIHFLNQLRGFFEENLQNVRIEIIRIDMGSIAVMFSGLGSNKA